MEMKALITNYLDDQGRIKVYPAKRKYKILILFYLASKFEQGKEYTELQINEIIKENHLFNDHCLLRRALVDHGFLSRSHNCTKYWVKIPQPRYTDFSELSDIF